MGIERLILTMQNQELPFMTAKTCDLYIAAMGEKAYEKAIKLTKALRDEGYWVEYDVMGRGLKAQMKYADKIGAKFNIVLGDNELETNSAKLKNMKSGESSEISLLDGFLDTFSNAIVTEMFSSVLDNI